MSNSRAFGILIGAIIFLLLLILKLFDIQILNYDESNFFAKQQQSRTEIIKAERGLIYDRNQVLLAYNRNDMSIYLDRRIKGEENQLDAAKKLASVFKARASYFLRLIKEDTTTICLQKKVPFEKRNLIKQAKLNSLYIKSDPTRIYQYDNLASHILGYVDNNFVGTDGIEKYFNNLLKGEDGRRIVDRSKRGRIITVDEKNTIPAKAGSNLHLTIDKKLQLILEEELRNGVAYYNAISACGILMNPNTGEILALANVDDYDPNNYSEYDDTKRRNKCIADAYEPGSTFKGIVLAALLDQGLCNENEIINCENGVLLFKGKKITDTHKFHFLTVKSVFEQSSNIGMHKLAQRMNNEVLYKYLRAFGFGNLTSIELPAEAKGELKKLSNWSGFSRSSLSRGYEILVTPIQLAVAYSALVNGGVLYQPQIVKKITTSEGETTFESSPKQVRRVISEETSKRMIKLLEGVVKNGTGKNAACDFISVGGKTGTSKILKGGKYLEAKYYSSFVGFYPVENPQVVCLILVHSPTVGGYGGLVAAPIFKSVTERVIASFGEMQDEKLNQSSGEDDLNIVKTNTTSNKKNNDVRIIFSNQDLNNKSINSKVMPSLKDLTISEAILLMNKIGLKYKIYGSGKVIAQSIDPGRKIVDNAVCIIVCSESLKSKFE